MALWLLGGPATTSWSSGPISLALTGLSSQSRSEEMTATQLPKSGLVKQDFKDKNWQGPLNQGFDAWEGRIGVAGAVDPQGVAQGFYIGQTFLNTATGVLW